MIPWICRNTLLTGDPLFSFTNSRNLVLDAFPGHSDLEMQLHVPVGLSSILGQFGSEIVTKFFRYVVRNILSISYWTNSFRGPFVFLLFFRHRHARPAILNQESNPGYSLDCSYLSPVYNTCDPSDGLQRAILPDVPPVDLPGCSH
jgi:hypothetical protein